MASRKPYKLQHDACPQCGGIKDYRSKQCIRCRPGTPSGVFLKESRCSVEGCDRLCHKGMWLKDVGALCYIHAGRWRRTGDPLAVKSTRGKVLGLDREADFHRRFMDSLVIGGVSDDGFTRHLIFTGHQFKTRSGNYGRQFKSVDGKLVGVLAHRYLYEQWVGPIPDGWELDHRPECPKNCVNPAHLTPMTKGDHVRLTWERARRGEEASGYVNRVKGGD